jgi:prepilin-type N-terminal cleavage/methylation domain-containing protein
MRPSSDPALRQSEGPAAAGFTLIELLVVVTIIVILLALLTPALDKAIEQAERVICASNLDGWGIGLSQHALERRNKLMILPKHGTTQDPQGWVYPNHPRYRKPAEGSNEAGQFNLDEIAPYVQGGDPGSTVRHVGDLWYCPSSQESFWQDAEHDRVASDGLTSTGFPLTFMYNDYAYFGHGGSTMRRFATHPQELVGNRLQGGRLLMADTIYRWNSGNGQWWFNHSEAGPSMHDNYGMQVFSGDPPLTGTNQLMGDGSVAWKDGREFDSVGMNARRFSAPPAAPEQGVKFVSESSDGNYPTTGGSMNFY